MPRSRMRECIDRHHDALDYLLCGLVAVFCQQLLETFFSKLFVMRIHRFRDSIAKKQQNIARSELDALLLETGAGEKAQDRTSCCQPDGLVIFLRTTRISVSS